jgi:hypothetical protein
MEKELSVNQETEETESQPLQDQPPPSNADNHSAATASGRSRITTRRWSIEEDDRLSQLVANSPDFFRISWSEIASQMENRSAKQCRERYINSLKPDGKKGLWTIEEDNNILRLQAMMGNQWSKIAASKLFMIL